MCCPLCRWVMLENVHLAPGWLMQLEKKLHSMQPHASFRLFLTMEINPKVSATHFYSISPSLGIEILPFQKAMQL